MRSCSIVSLAAMVLVSPWIVGGPSYVPGARCPIHSVAGDLMNTRGEQCGHNWGRFYRGHAAAAGLGMAWSTMGKASAAVLDAASEGFDVVNAAYDVFFALVLLAFLKNNLVDYNGPLAGLFGAEVPTCKASHILVKTEEEAQDLLVQLNGQESPPTLENFSAMATAHSKCKTAKKGGSLGDVFQGQMVNEFDEACFGEKTPLGVPFGPIKTQYGYHLIWVSERSVSAAA